MSQLSVKFICNSLQESKLNCGATLRAGEWIYYSLYACAHRLPLSTSLLIISATGSVCAGEIIDSSRCDYLYCPLFSPASDIRDLWRPAHKVRYFSKIFRHFMADAPRGEFTLAHFKAPVGAHASFLWRVWAANLLIPNSKHNRQKCLF